MVMTSPTNHLTDPVSARDHIWGALAAQFQLLEYGDYECPFCGQAYAVVEEIKRLLDVQLCFAYRHFPLVRAHPHAVPAAEAAEAAAAQGKFWEMHSRLFEHQDALDHEMLVYHAVQIGLDVDQFIGDLVEHRFIGRLQDDMSSGTRSGVKGTPTFFVNGIRFDQPADVGSLIAALRLTPPIRS
jgi:protein-disulfide isomerase